jgi:hypothetical protein
MTHVRDRARSRWTALVAALAVAVGGALAVGPTAAQENDLFTDHVVPINGTVSDAGFVHPGIGLSAENLRHAQEMVRSGQEPWASYFDALTQAGFWTSRSYGVDNMVRGKPDVPVTNTFTQGGLRNRLTRDSFGVLTQATLWVMTGDEAYRKGAIMGLRTWSNMDPDGYAYFPDAHIHTGKPLSQFLMAAEIIRATDPVDDDTPGTYDGYDVTWDAADDEKLLTNFANPIVNVFNFSNEKWMNQHNFGLYGRIATAIYADDVEGYAKGVEWFTMNSTFDNYINGSLGQQIQHIEADHPLNPYGYEFTQVREMGRDQAHGETNIDNFAALARFLDVQGTKVDPVDGTVSTAGDAVSAYAFLDDRLLHGADAFYGFMMGSWTPWIDERETGGTISQAYRGRIFNPLSELYYQYTYKEGVDVETEAPHLALLHERMDGPFFRYGTGTHSFWAPGDKSIEYWMAFPPELSGTEPTPTEDTEVTFGRYALPLDDGTEILAEDGRTFARATADEDGTTSVVSRLMYPGNSQMGVLVRTDGPATLEVLDKEKPNELNPSETEPRTMASLELPDTQGEWRYITYPAAGQNTHFYRVSGDGATVDLDAVMFDAGKHLTPPRFEQARDRLYLWPEATSSFDLSAADESGSVAYTADGLPEGASLDPETGALTWKPTPRDRGTHEVQIVADDGESVAARTFELVVSKNRAKLIRDVVADGTDEDAVYTSVTSAPFQEALAGVQAVADEEGTDEEFRDAIEALLDAIDGLELLNPRLGDGSLDYTGAVTPTVISDGGLRALADGDSGSHFGDLRVASVTLDFGTRYRVAADELGLQARFSFPMRSEGTNVYGSNDGMTWTLLTERATSNTNEMESIPVVAEHRGEPFRYLKLQVDDPGIPIDPAYPGIWNIGELRIHGDRSEVPGAVTDVSLSSPDALRERVTAGDMVSLEFASPTPIDDVAVTIAGRSVEATSEDGLAWSASTRLGDVDGGGPLPITIDHTTDEGDVAAIILGTTDGSGLYTSDERNLVDIAGAAQVVDADGNPDPGKSGHAAAMLDGNVGSASDVADVDGEFHVIWDFGEGGTIRLDRADFLARQDNNGLTRMADQVLEGSNDLHTWTRLTDPTVAELDWQNLDSLEEGTYRYLRVSNGNRIGIAELRVFGDFRVDLDAVIARAEAVDLGLYSRASGMLFTRELEAVKAAADEDGADRAALSRHLLDAWGLLEAPPSSIMPVEQSWVTASSASWDGSRDAAANGWAMFDGDPSTFTDTKTAEGWVRVLPDDGRTLTVETVRVQPRSGYVNRANGFQVQGSNDGGATWETFVTISTPASSGWTEFTLEEAVSYGALRLYSPNGYTNLAELQFVRIPVDVTGLDLLLEETGDLSQADWTAESWAELTEAREAGLALREPGANPAQTEVDTATDSIAATAAALVAAG